MKKRSKKKMLVIVAVLLLIIGIITVFFHISYSKTKAEFSEIICSLLTKMPNESSIFTEEDIVDLPLPVQKYFRYCGYIGTPKMSYIKAIYQDVDFLFEKDKPTIKIDYTQYNFANEPIRIAYIDSSMYGTPFEGLDSYTAGNGSMKGVLAKLFTFYGITASGIFTFNENGEMLSFTTDDREATAIDGTSEKVKWSSVCSEYVETNGIRKPTVLQAIWHYDDGDLVYFDGKDIVIEFDYEQES